MNQIKTALLLVLGMLCIYSSTRAQFVNFPSEGVIEFEKKVNMHAIFRKVTTKDNEFYMQKSFEQYKKTQPQFKVFKSTLLFNASATLFTPIEDESLSAIGGFISEHPAVKQPNIVYTDLSTGLFTAQKRVFEQSFLVRDSLRNIKWKITDETREIAGFMCRRANAVIMDSVYVVAFYTDKIPVSGGPESFSGLPGMILGVALPHENVSWFAKSVTEKPVPAGSLKIPAKGKVQNQKELQKTLADVIKNWGDMAKELCKLYLL